MGFMNIVFSVVKKILETLLFPIKPIIDPILSLGEAMVHMLELLLKIIELIPKLMSVFEIFTDPVKVIKDAVYAFKTGIMMILDALFGGIIRIITKTFVTTKEDTIKKKKCYNKSIFNILLLVLCPPLAIFAKYGIGYIIYIVIASFLTYFYYFPGLIYSSLYIL